MIPYQYYSSNFIFLFCRVEGNSPTVLLSRKVSFLTNFLIHFFGVILNFFDELFDELFDEFFDDFFSSCFAGLKVTPRPFYCHEKSPF